MSSPPPELVLGTFSLRCAGERQAFDVFDRFAESGGRVIETGAAYGRGRSERILADWIHSSGWNGRVWSKVGYLNELEGEWSLEACERVYQKTLELFGDSIARLSLHELDDISWEELGADGLLHVIDDMRRLVSEVGATGNSAAQLSKIALKYDVEHLMLAKQFDLLWRNAGPVLVDGSFKSVCLASPLHQGWLLNLVGLADVYSQQGDTHAEYRCRELFDILNTISVSPLQACVSFAHCSGADYVCFGPSSAAEVDSFYSAWGSVRLSDEVLSFAGMSRPAMPGVPIELLLDC